jgi:tRNA synthetases class II (D, K and N)
MRVNDDGRTVAAMHVLAPGIGEIIGGNQREERLEQLDQNMAERGIDKEHYAWYRDLRLYGTLPPPLPNPPSLVGGGWGPRLRAHPRLRYRPFQCA